MMNLKILVAFALLAITSPSFATPQTSSNTSINGSNDLPKPSYARTMLKVSRSLPGETEELKVRTSEGNVATLIVKRREKSVSSDIPSLGVSSSEARTTTTTTTTKTPTTSATIGYQNVEVDPWNRLQTWSSVSSSNGKIEQDNESRNWVPVNRGFDSWKPVEQPFATVEPKRISWLVADQMQNSRSFQTIPANDNSNERIIRYAFLPHEPRRSVRTNVGANLMKNRDAKNVPAEVVVRSEISVKPQPGQPQMQAKRLPISLDADGTPVVHGRRVPDEPIDKIQVWRNARVINDQLVTDISTSSTTTSRALSAGSGQSFERFFEDVNRRYGKTSEENSVNPKTYRNEALAAEIYETAEDTYRPSIRKRMLQPEVVATYPNSRIYSPSESPLPVKSSVPSVKPGTRAPVLQYAHPELGVQPAKVVKNEKRKNEETPTELPAPRPTYSYQTPGQNHYSEYRQKKKYVLNDKNIVDSYTYKNYYPNQHFYGLKRPMSEPPFWIKISQNIKSQFTDGVAKVSELTKPVFDPLVEATRKISENLGLSGSRSQDPAQDKVGSVATSSSVLIPALGLVASGAALGIGAVAVGRYLDVDVLKRSNEAGALDYVDDDGRALRVISQLDNDDKLREKIDAEGERNGNDVYVLVQEGARRNEGVSRRKRSNVDVDEDSRRLQRKGADQIAEIVEIDLPSRSLEDATVDVSNDVRLENEEAIAKAIVKQTLEAFAHSSPVKKNQQKEQTRQRRRRSSNLFDSDAELNDALQNLENAEVAEADNNSHVNGDWTNTPCAKRIFCDAMIKRGSDAYMLMEKKMSELLRMIQASAAVQVSAHFDEVMEAVRRHDCSVFSCPRARPASVFY